MTRTGHLCCTSCRIRLHASAPAVALLEARCPICEAALVAVPASSAIGFRFFDLDPLSEQVAQPTGDATRASADFAVESAAALAVRVGLDARHPPRLP